jgi:hypothetical protein
MVQNLLEGAAENIAKRAAQLAEEGNVAAIRICMNRARQGAPWRPLLLRFVEALNAPVVAPVMGLFGGRRDSLFANPFK